MLKHIVSIGNLILHERHILIHGHGKVTKLTLTRRLQAGIAGGALTCVAAFGVHAYQSHEAERAAQLEQAETIELVKAQLAEARQAAAEAEQKLQQLAAPESQTADNETAVPQDDADTAALADKVASRITLLEKELRSATEQQKALKADRERLAAEKGKLQNKVGELQQVKEKVVQTERDQKTIASERDRLRERVSELEKKLQRLSEANIARRNLALADTQGEDEELSEGGFEQKTGGFDLNAFLAKYEIGMRHTGAMGGPYVALGNRQSEVERLDPEAKALLKSLPVTAPLDHFQLESGFGVRIDPINGRHSVHTGLDFSAPYQSPVYSTSAGIVVGAGYSGAYGKMVEIDHGHGIHTRYAHLNRLMVNVGQRVPKHAEIGLLGSTGRSTGPHVHYEVTVNGVPEDPEKFLAAGHMVELVRASE